MGHFSRYLLPGATRVEVANSVEAEAPPLSPADIKNGAALSFVPCESASLVQHWTFKGAKEARGGDGLRQLVAAGTDGAPGSDGYGVGGECLEACLTGDCWFPKAQVWACGGTDGDALHGGAGNQVWSARVVKGGTQLVNPASGKCLTAVDAAGWAVGLDAGVKVVAAQLHPCADAGATNQTFVLGGDGQGDGLSDGAFTVGTADGTRCLQPQLERLPHFDAVAFENPDGTTAVVVMNTRDEAVDFTLRGAKAGVGVSHSIPGHAIHTYRWRVDADADAAIALAEVADAAAPPPAPAFTPALALAAAAAATVGVGVALWRRSRSTRRGFARIPPPGTDLRMDIVVDAVGRARIALGGLGLGVDPVEEDAPYVALDDQIAARSSAAAARYAES